MSRTCWQQFQQQVRNSGMEPHDCGCDHWQIRGGPLLVNYWPNTGRIYVSATARSFRGNVADAIKAAQTPPKIRGRRDRRSPNGYRKVRARMFRKQKNCRWCGCQLTLTRYDEREDVRFATLDHIIPLHRGGLNNPNNYTLACEPCNKMRGHEMPEILKGS